MVAKLSYKPKSKVLYRDRVWAIVRPVTSTSVLVEDAASGETQVVTVAELSPPVPKAVEAARRASPRPLDEASLAEAKRRLAIIKPLLDRTSRFTEAVEEEAKTIGVHPATLFRWIKLYRDGGQLSHLAPLRRNRAMPTKLDDRVEAIIRSVIDDYYLTRQQYSGTKGIEEVERRCRAAGLKAPHANSIQPAPAHHPSARGPDQTARPEGSSR